jgi:hypothetical protein
MIVLLEESCDLLHRMPALRSGFALSFLLLLAACGGGDTGRTGSSGGGSNATGGASFGGSGGMGNPTGGTGNAVGTGGVSSGTGGTVTAGTDGSACADTQTDPRNCGTCGHVCRGTCTGGKCDPSWFVCFDRTQFDSCQAYCVSIRATCSTACGSSQAPWLGWVDGSQIGCNAHVAPNAIGTGQSCSSPLPAQAPGGVVLFNCCCAE